MNYIKIRGHRRRQKDIEKWIQSASSLNIDNLKLNKYEYTKVYVQPWGNLTLKNSEIPEPKRETRDRIINGLAVIYNNWKVELDKLCKSYYLRIWLYEPRISKSQVVCAIDERIEYYQNIFINGEFDFNKSDLLKRLNADFKWEAGIDEDSICESDLLWPIDQYENIKDCYSDRRLLKKLKQKAYRKFEFDAVNGKKDIMYFIPKGKIWIGGKYTPFGVK